MAAAEARSSTPDNRYSRSQFCRHSVFVFVAIFEGVVITDRFDDFGKHGPHIGPACEDEDLIAVDFQTIGAARKILLEDLARIRVEILDHVKGVENYGLIANCIETAWAF